MPCSPEQDLPPLELLRLDFQYIAPTADEGGPRARPALDESGRRQPAAPAGASHFRCSNPSCGRLYRAEARLAVCAQCGPRWGPPAPSTPRPGEQVVDLCPSGSKSVPRSSSHPAMTPRTPVISRDNAGSPLAGHDVAPPPPPPAAMTPSPPLSGRNAAIPALASRDDDGRPVSGIGGLAAGARVDVAASAGSTRASGEAHPASHPGAGAHGACRRAALHPLRANLPVGASHLGVPSWCRARGHIHAGLHARPGSHDRTGSQAGPDVIHPPRAASQSDTVTQPEGVPQSSALRPPSTDEGHAPAPARPVNPASRERPVGAGRVSLGQPRRSRGLLTCGEWTRKTMPGGRAAK